MKKRDVYEFLAAVAILISICLVRNWLGYGWPGWQTIAGAIASAFAIISLPWLLKKLRLYIRARRQAPLETCPTNNPGTGIPPPTIIRLVPGERLVAGETIRKDAELICKEGGVVYEKPPVDIWPARLASLVVYSGLFVDKPSWTGTAAELRAALVAPGSKLGWRNQRELPPAAVLEHKLRGMTVGRGRLVVVQAGIKDGTVSIWTISPAEPRFTITPNPEGPAS